MNLVLRTRGEATEVAAEVRREIARLDPALAPSRMASLESIIAASVGQRRLTTLLLGIFSAAALCLAAIGLYGVLSYTVTRRKHEIGVRVALGASAATVRARVVGHGLALATLGTVLGLLASFAISRLVASLLFGVTPNDPMIFASVPLLLSMVAMLASYFPARQATRVDPVVALRAE
jgi:putative ABC transport system permease protein